MHRNRSLLQPIVQLDVPCPAGKTIAETVSTTNFHRSVSCCMARSNGRRIAHEVQGQILGTAQRAQRVDPCMQIGIAGDPFAGSRANRLAQQLQIEPPPVGCRDQSAARDARPNPAPTECSRKWTVEVGARAQRRATRRTDPARATGSRRAARLPHSGCSPEPTAWLPSRSPRSSTIRPHTRVPATDGAGSCCGRGHPQQRTVLEFALPERFVAPQSPGQLWVLNPDRVHILRLPPTLDILREPVGRQIPFRSSGAN